MNVVVESRKRFGRACTEYDQKILLMENRLLNLQVETVSNYRIKPKSTPPNVDECSSKDLDDLIVELTGRQKYIEDMMERLDNTQEVIRQLAVDIVDKKLRAPLTAENMLAQAKAKNV